MMTHLSKKQARKFIVLCNDFHHNKKNTSLQATIESFNTLGYVQLDTISVVNRAHLHVLWSRNHHFNENHLEQLFEQKKIFEYWSHAAAMLPIKDFKYSLIRKQQVSNGEINWYKNKPDLMDYVKDVITLEGPKKSSDFKHKKKTNNGWWDWKPTKLALEQLFMEGEIMVQKRQGFQKLYDLTENVLPSKINESMPTIEEYCQHLTIRYLYAQGLGTAENIAYLRKGLKPRINECLMNMHEAGELELVSVNQQEYYALPHRLALLSKRLHKKVHILSPFDNMLIQRNRILDVFDYDYQIECYVPAAKRKFGYFCLPILYGNDLVGRIDCKAHRKEQVLEIKAYFQEKTIKDQDKYNHELKLAIDEFAKFNYCNDVVFEK